MSHYKADSDTLLGFILPRLPEELQRSLLRDARATIVELKGKPGNDLLPTLECFERATAWLLGEEKETPPASNPTSRL